MDRESELDSLAELDDAEGMPPTQPSSTRPSSTQAPSKQPSSTQAPSTPSAQSMTNDQSPDDQSRNDQATNTQSPNTQSPDTRSQCDALPPFDLASVWVLIPALNEQEGIVEVLRALPKVGRVIVVDNGSTDNTSEAATSLGAFVVKEPSRGYGSACLAGLAAVEESTSSGEDEPKVIVFVDADHSDSPELLPLLVTPIFADEQDLVIGSRMLGKREPGSMPPVAVFGNHLSSWLMRTLWGAPFTDLGPFRAIRYKSLQQLGMRDCDFGWTIEMQLKALKQKLRCTEVPVPYRSRVGTSKISGTIVGSIKAGTKILYCIAKHSLFPHSK